MLRSKEVTEPGCCIPAELTSAGLVYQDVEGGRRPNAPPERHRGRVEREVASWAQVRLTDKNLDATEDVGDGNAARF